jgi:hypothetical protein
VIFIRSRTAKPCLLGHKFSQSHSRVSCLSFTQSHRHALFRFYVKKTRGGDIHDVCLGFSKKRTSPHDRVLAVSSSGGKTEDRHSYLQWLFRKTHSSHPLCFGFFFLEKENRGVDEESESCESGWSIYIQPQSRTTPVGA